jgi:hypothetical protein
MGLRAWCGGCAAVFLMCATAAAEPRREGFTGDLGIGFALTSVPVRSISVTGVSGPVVMTQQVETRELKAGLAPLSLSLGGFLSEDVALLFRLTGTSYFEDGDQFGHNFYGPVVEIWPIDRLYLGGGVGFAVFGPNPLTSSSDADPETGWALEARAGVALINSENHDLTLSAEFIPGFYEGDAVQGYAFIVAWKWY